jgi:hypothetical protein
MAFTVSTFKTQLATGHGAARPALYKIDINSPTGIGQSFSGSSNLLVKAAAIPASTIAPLTVNYYGRAYKTPGFRTFDVWNVTVINDENMAARQNIMEWMVAISGQLRGNRAATIGGRFGTTAEGDATVTQIGIDGTDQGSWKMHNLWPTELGEIGLDWSSDAIEEYTVAFSYDYWSQGVKKEEEKSVVKSDPKLG